MLCVSYSKYLGYPVTTEISWKFRLLPAGMAHWHGKRMQQVLGNRHNRVMVHCEHNTNNYDDETSNNSNNYKDNNSISSQVVLTNPDSGVPPHVHLSPTAAPSSPPLTSPLTSNTHQPARTTKVLVRCASADRTGGTPIACSQALPPAPQFTSKERKTTHETK